MRTPHTRIITDARRARIQRKKEKRRFSEQNETTFFTKVAAIRGMSCGCRSDEFYADKSFSHCRPSRRKHYIVHTFTNIIYLSLICQKKKKITQSSNNYVINIITTKPTNRYCAFETEFVSSIPHY